VALEIQEHLESAYPLPVGAAAPGQEGNLLLHELFEAQAGLRPDRTAIIFGCLSLSYRQLDDEARRLAGVLSSWGIGKGSLVGIFMGRSHLPLVAIIGVLKTGAAYVPIDPACPGQRLGQIVQDSELQLLLADATTQDVARQAIPCERILMAPAFRGPCEYKAAPPAAADIEQGDACYVIYTSGSTGRPKGVVIEHRNAVAYVRAASRGYGIRDSDRIYQGFSLAFDASVEEVWLALVNGGTLVVAPGDVTHCPELAAKFIADNRISVLSTTPTFLAMIDSPLVGVRLLILGGEVCPDELAARFACGRRLLNTYGPTEATVVSTMALCQAGQSVTIGRALDGWRLAVVDEKLQPVARGEAGELLIGGAGVARGYLKQAELTAQRFIEHPQIGRCFRSGDRVRQLENGELVFLGRNDAQLKVRGFRVEPAEIEAVLLQQPGVRAAVVTLHDPRGVCQLAAYIVAETPAEPDRSAIAVVLRRRLPDYMVPAYLDTLAALPTLASGKVDRAALPAPRSPMPSHHAMANPPRTQFERQLASAWSVVLGHNALDLDDDFFRDLGGHSLLAARVITQLRATFNLAVSVRDLYTHPTIRSLASLLDGSPPSYAAPSAARAASVSSQAEVPRRRLLCQALQCLAQPLLAGLPVAPLVLAAWLWGRCAAGALGAGVLAGGCAILVLTSYPVMLAVSVLAKWLLIGRYRAETAPLWGWGYFRWWLATRIQALVGVELLAGTPFLNWYFRLMGARVGRGCVLGTSQCWAFDLVEIGDNTSIGAETHLLGCRVEPGGIRFAPVKIGRGCFIGKHCALGLDVAMGEGARLDDLSLLSDGQRMADGQGRRGSPSQAAAVAVPQSMDSGQMRRAPLLHALAIITYFVSLTLGALPTLVVAVWLMRRWGLGWAMTAAPVTGTIYVLAMVGVIIACKWLVLGRVAPGDIRVGSPLYVRKWLFDRLLAFSRTALLPIYATLYTPPFLRLLGARIGRRCEVSTVSHINPEMFEAGDESFLADGALIGGMRIHDGVARLGVNRIGRRTFIGNSAVLGVGACIGNETLIGCLSIPPEGGPPADGSNWLGSPPFALPRRQEAPNFDASVIFNPTPWMVTQRLACDAFRIVSPATIMTAGVQLLAWFAYHWPGGVTMLLGASAFIALGLLLVAALSVVAMKWLLMWRFRPTVAPLWSRYVWINEIINGAFEAIFAPAVSAMLGTGMVAVMLRLIGCRIGKGACIHTTLFSEFDLVTIGDGAVLNHGATIQTHLFEDRVMKSSYVNIGAGACVGNMAVVLYDTCIREGATLAPLSLLMKGESLNAHQTWVGIPTVAAEGLGEALAPAK